MHDIAILDYAALAIFALRKSRYYSLGNPLQRNFLELSFLIAVPKCTIAFSFESFRDIVTLD